MSRMKKNYDTSTKDEAVRRYGRGDDIKVIAAELGISSNSTIYGWLGRAGVPLRQKRKARTPKPAVQSEPTWEQIKTATLTAFEQASKVPGLEEEINSLRNKLAALQNHVKILEEDNKVTTDESHRYHLAVQQGEVASGIAKEE